MKTHQIAEAPPHSPHVRAAIVEGETVRECKRNGPLPKGRRHTPLQGGATRPLLLLGGLSLLFSAGTVAQGDAPSAPDVVRQVRATLPQTPVTLSGELQARNRRGEIQRVLPLQIELDWGATPPRADYVLQDRFGRPLEWLRVEWSTSAGQPQLVLIDLETGEAHATLRADRAVPELDLNWIDLTLNFLWWETDAQFIGYARVRGRSCRIVDVFPPPQAPAGEYGRVRLWIDEESALLMQAESYDHQNHPVRRVQVKSIRRMDEMWMIQNLDIIRHSTRERVTLRIRNAENVEAH